jgi:hypothetical protein
MKDTKENILDDFDKEFPRDFLTKYQFDEDLKEDIKEYISKLLDALLLNKEDLGKDIYELCLEIEISTNRKLDWDELSPNWKDFYIRIGDAVAELQQSKLESMMNEMEYDEQ